VISTRREGKKRKENPPSQQKNNAEDIKADSTSNPNKNSINHQDLPMTDTKIKEPISRAKQTRTIPTPRNKRQEQPNSNQIQVGKGRKSSRL
jgi:hypothetical protein